MREKNCDRKAHIVISFIRHNSLNSRVVPSCLRHGLYPWRVEHADREAVSDVRSTSM